MTPLDQEFYTREELAHLLKLTTRTIDRLVGAGGLTAYKIGGSTRFRREDIERYLEAHRKGDA